MFAVERIVGDLKGNLLRREMCYGATSLSALEADPRRLLALNRGHWIIEALHHVRDVTFDEDRSRIRRRNGARTMSCLRNLAIGLLRMAGAKNIAAAVRYCYRNAAKALRLIGL